MKDKFILSLLILGIIVTAYIIVFDWEYKLLEAEVGLIDKLLLSSPEDPAKLVEKGSVISYLAQMGFWFSFLVLLGMVWSGFLFPKRPIVERVMFSLPFGVLVMPISFVMPAWIISLGKIISENFGSGEPPAPPAYYGPIVGKIVGLISNNQEQGYEIANVLIFLVVGLIILGISKLKKQPKQI